MLTITDTAATKAKEVFERKGLSDGALRLFVVSGGCSGYQYGMVLAPKPEEDDLVIEKNGVKIVVDADSAPMVQGAEIDYVDDIMKSGFTIHNPNATKSCGCGTSFQTADGGGDAKPCGSQQSQAPSHQEAGQCGCGSGGGGCSSC